MQIEVRLFAVLAERAGTAAVQVELASDAPLTMAALKALVMQQFPAVGDLGFASGVVGTSYVADDTVVQLDSQVALLPPVSGGQPDSLEAGVFELSAAPIDPGELGRRVGDDACGAIVTFCGTTRNKNRGQAVEQLDYEAFEAMAGPEMARIFERCNAAFGPAAEGADEPAERLLRMLCVHRTGVVPVGEPSVVIAVASPHRDPAFDAARFLIDELKKSLPVWKKEHYADGHHWIGDRS
jgi:molybdopterin synthase catalytic subunit